MKQTKEEAKIKRLEAQIKTLKETIMQHEKTIKQQISALHNAQDWRRKLQVLFKEIVLEDTSLAVAAHNSGHWYMP
jgi:peptidoglycan hydrolase CwlO-like protein